MSVSRAAAVSPCWSPCEDTTVQSPTVGLGRKVPVADVSLLKSDPALCFIDTPRPVFPVPPHLTLSARQNKHQEGERLSISMEGGGRGSDGGRVEGSGEYNRV